MVYDLGGSFLLAPRGCEDTVLGEDLEVNDPEWNSPGGEQFQKMFDDIITKFAHETWGPTRDDGSDDDHDDCGYGNRYRKGNGNDNRNGFGEGNMGLSPSMFNC